MKKVIATAAAPAAIGPYSQGVDGGSIVITSGQLPINAATGAFAEGGIAGQTRQSLENVKAVLAQAGLGMENIIKTTVFLKDMNDFAAMNEVYASFFPRPAAPWRLPGCRRMRWWRSRPSRCGNQRAVKNSCEIG